MTDVMHARPYRYSVGSVHKYAAMLARICDLREVVGQPADIAVQIRRCRPDVGVCGGDWWQHWEAFRQSDVPYILVEHDIGTMRCGESKAKRERAMIEGASAVLFTSEDHLAYCDARYRLPHTELVHLRPLARALEFTPLPKLPGKNLVYAGGIVMWADRHGPYGYRAYHNIFKAFLAAGWRVHIYPCYTTDTSAITNEYAAIGCEIHAQVDEDALPRELSQYTAGLQAFADEGCDPLAFAYTQACRPNKTWSYLAAGIPTIGYNAGATAEIYRDRWGIVLDSLDDIPGMSLPRVTAALRTGQVMDGDLPAFRRLLEAALTAGATSSHPVKGVSAMSFTTTSRVYGKDPNGRRILLHPAGARISDDEARQLGLVKGKAAPKTDEPKAAKAAADKPVKRSYADIKAEATSLGIEFKANIGSQKLQVLIDEHKAAAAKAAEAAATADPGAQGAAGDD